MTQVQYVVYVPRQFCPSVGLFVTLVSCAKNSLGIIAFFAPCYTKHMDHRQ